MRKTLIHFAVVVFHINVTKERGSQLSFVAVIAVGVIGIVIIIITRRRRCSGSGNNYCNDQNHKASNIRYNSSNIATKGQARVGLSTVHVTTSFSITSLIL